MRFSRSVTVFCLLLILGGTFGWGQILLSSPLEKSFAKTGDSLAPGARLGLSVRSVRTGEVVHQINGEGWFVPASTMKVLVTAAAIDTLPLHWAPLTMLQAEGTLKNRGLYGTIRLQGRGDPNISGRYYSDAMEPLRFMVDSLRKRGIDTLYGDVVFDTSWFHGPRKPEGWRRNFFDAWYGAEVTPLSFNDNCFSITLTAAEKPGMPVMVKVMPDVGYIEVVNQATTQLGNVRRIQYALDPTLPRITLTGSLGRESTPLSLVLPVRNPARMFASAFQKAMRDAGIVVIPQNHPGNLPKVFSLRFEGPPLLSMLDEINQRSQNLHAELLLRGLGADVLGDGSAQGGLRAVRAFLGKWDLPIQDFHMVDASGLSPDNRLRPNSLTKMLATMARHPRGQWYVSSLGLPGVTGTTAKRLSDSDVAHRIRFKTGFIGGVQGLAGYIATSLNDTLAVAMYLNGYQGIPDQVARDLLDTMWSKLALLHNMELASVIEARRLWNGARSIQDYHARLDYFSKALLTRPYKLGPTGEGALGLVENMPLMQMNAFDCVTYIEHAMALAAATHPDSVLPVLQRIRYEKGVVSYPTRKHYFVEDWIKKSPQWVALRPMKGDTTITRTMDKKRFFTAKNLPWSQANPSTEIPYLPMDRSIILSRRWDGPDTLIGVAFVSTLPNLCVTHTGILVAKTGQRPLLRHASSQKRMVVEQDFGEYLDSRKGKAPGVLFFDFLGVHQHGKQD